MAENDRLEHIEEDIKENKRFIEALENQVDTLDGDMRSINQWKNGNGAIGAEGRLQKMETCIEAIKETGLTEDSMKRIGEAAANFIVTKAKSGDRTTVAKIRAWAPYFVGGIPLVMWILEKLR